jgi:hypothetical protein
MRTRPDLAEYIRTALPRSKQAVSFARTCESFMRADWDDIKIRKVSESLWYSRYGPEMKADRWTSSWS